MLPVSGTFSVDSPRERPEPPHEPDELAPELPLEPAEPEPVDSGPADPEPAEPERALREPAFPFPVWALAAAAVVAGLLIIVLGWVLLPR